MDRTITARFPCSRQWCMIASVADSKSDLRARIRAARAKAVAMPGSGSDAAGLLETAQSAGLLDPQGDAGPLAIAAYIAAPGEPDVAAIRAVVRAAGGVVLLPVPLADRTLDWAHDDGHYRPDGRYPIEVPAGRVVGSGAAGLLAHGIRMILVPALAVDGSGARLGQGGGYYDRLLSQLARPVTPVGRSRDTAAGHASAAEVRVVAVVRDEELLPEGSVPIEAHDRRMHAVLTPTRFVRLDG